MNLGRIKEVLTTINSIGIDEVVFEKDDNVVVRGMDKDNTVVVISQVDNDLVEKSMGVNRIPTFISRLNLFNLDESKITVDFREDSIRSVNVSEKRKKVGINLPTPGQLKAPHFNHKIDIKCRIKLTKEEIETISNAVTAISPEFITMKGDGSDIVLELKDANNDVYNDVIGENGSGDWINNWSVKSFVRLLKQSKKNTEEVILGVDAHGLLYFPADGMDFILLPQIVE